MRNADTVYYVEMIDSNKATITFPWVDGDKCRFLQCNYMILVYLENSGPRGRVRYKDNF